MHSTTSVLPGYTILRRPSPQGKSDETNGTEAATLVAVAERDATQTESIAMPRREQVAGILTLWLEVLAGRRPTSILTKGPFHERVIAFTSSLRSELGTRAVLELKSLHLQPPITSTGGYRTEVRFCATVLVGGRVRALAGTLCLRRLKSRVPLTQLTTQKESRGANHWRLETLTLI